MDSPQYQKRLEQFTKSPQDQAQLNELIDDLIVAKTQHLQQERDLAQYYLDQTHAMLLVLNRIGEITYVNQSICDVMGYTAEELIGKNWFNLAIPEEDRAMMYSRFLNVIEGNRNPPKKYENLIICQDGSKRLIQWHNTYTHNLVTGEVSGVFSSGNDITIQRVIEDALHQNELRYRQMFYANNAVKIVLHPQTGDIIDVNQAACDFYGYRYEKLITMNIGQINVKSVEELIAQDGDNPEDRGVFSYQHRLSSGEIRDVEIYTGPMTLEDEVLRFSVVIDVTERERAKQDLQLRESQLRTVVNNFPGALLMFDTNKQALVARGQLHLQDMDSLADLEGQSLPDTLPQKIWELAETMYDDALNGKTAYSDLTFSERQFIQQLSPMYDDNDNLIGGLHLLQDVTDLHQSQLLLEQTKTQLYTILDGIVDGVAIVAPPEHLLYCNDSAAHILGYDSAIEMSKAMKDNLYIPSRPMNEQGQFLPFEEQNIYKALQGQLPDPQLLLFHNATADEAIWAEVKARPIFDDDDTVRFVIVIMTDRTRAREIEQFRAKMLKEQAQIDILRTYIANTTHDLAQPISVINTTLYMLDRTVQDDIVQKRTATIHEQTTRIQTILEDIREISTLDTLTQIDRVKTYSHELVDGLTTHFQDQLTEKSLILHQQHQTEPTTLMCHPKYMRRALRQVMQNAIDYSPNNSEILLSTTHENDMFIIEITDHGVGIPKADLDHVLDRFFRVDKSRTTSPRSGTGLGLSITKRIVELHQGELKIDSKEGVGTTVQIHLPTNLE